MELRYDRKIVIVGINGSGKSILLGSLMEVMDRLIDYDMEGEHIIQGAQTVKSLSELYEALKKGVTKIRYDTSHLNTREENRKEFERLARYFKGAGLQNYFIIVDEAHEVYTEGHPLGALTEWLDLRGRKHGLGLTISTQRPAKLHKDVFSQCSKILVMASTSNYDLTYLKKIGFRDIFEQVRSLEEFEFVDICSGEQYERVLCST